MIKILIVDDEFIMRQGLRYMINWEQEGYEIVGEATNGSEALKLIQTLNPHIIICDIVMPLLDGVDFSEAVHKMYPKIQTIIVSGYDNFEYVKSTLMNGAVDYILKPTLNQEELRKILKKAAQRIPGYKGERDVGAVSLERMMERYLLGHDTKLDSAEFSRRFNKSYFIIYAVNINKCNENGQDMSEVLYKKMEREVQNPDDVSKLMITIREGLVCIIWGYDRSQKKKLMQRLLELNMQLEMLCSFIFGVVSSPFSQLEQIREVYQQEIVKKVDKAFYYQDTKLLFLENLDETKEGITVDKSDKFDFFRYNRMLGSKQYTEAIKLLKQYNETSLEAQMDVERIKNQMKNMIYNFLDFLQLPDEEREEHRYTFFKEITQTMYKEQYLRCMSNIMDMLLSLAGQSESKTDDRIVKMLEYIAENFEEDLRLEDLAQEFNFNYHYLSSYFSQQMKEGFSDYLNRIRIEKACGLLRENNLSISQVSSAVGYSEHSYFCRVFKKITGKTPSVWRRSGGWEG